MRRLLPFIVALLTFAAIPAKAVSDFVPEAQMKDGLLQMLADFTTYMKNDFQPCQAPNSLDEPCGCFRGENTMANDERGVRPNADLGMICAFLVKYAKGRVQLPADVTWDDLERMAMQSLVFAYSTHKANRLKVCKGNNYWGSTSTDDAVWESSLWALSVAYSAFFQWDKLSETQRSYIYQLLKAECNYEMHRNIPTGYAGDTKAEENGWEADVLAATLGLFPDDPLAPQWFARLREFAINSYSQKDDAADQTVIDPGYDSKTVADLYRGQNLYDDYTLQNHNYFHTSYQNVVIQELGEAALALKLFQTGLHGTEKWQTNALMHNNDRVMRDVLYWLALADGELAMPNGNDWSLFLYDQITSYSTNACFLRDPHALMLENRAYMMIKARQQTTTDGSWLLRPDVGARRMGVEAHRVMMTWLMHEVHSTADLSPTRWDDFVNNFSQAKHFTSQNIIRAATPHRFTCFSWSTGLRSYTGYISPSPSTLKSQISNLKSQTSNLIVPFRANNTGNFIGWYEVQGRKTNATPVVSGNYQLDGNSYVMNGELQTNDEALNNRFALYSTTGNAVVYIDNVRANADATITAERGGLMAISVDEMTKTTRTLYTKDGSQQLDGTTMTTMNGPWVNIDNTFGIVTAQVGHAMTPSKPPRGEASRHSPSGDTERGQPKAIAFGERDNNNSVMTAKLYACYSDQSRTVRQGDIVDRRAIIYYSNVTADETAHLASLTVSLPTPEGWSGIIVPNGTDDSTYSLLLSNFSGASKCVLTDVNTPEGKPVFPVPTTIGENGSSATFTIDKNHSAATPLRFLIQGSNVEATLNPQPSTLNPQPSTLNPQPSTLHLQNLSKSKNPITVTVLDASRRITKKVKLTQKPLTLTLINGRLVAK